MLDFVSLTGICRNALSSAMCDVILRNWGIFMVTILTLLPLKSIRFNED